MKCLGLVTVFLGDAEGVWHVGAAGMWQFKRGFKRSLGGLWLCTQVEQPILSKMVMTGAFWLVLRSANPRVWESTESPFLKQNGPLWLC